MKHLVIQTLLLLVVCCSCVTTRDTATPLAKSKLSDDECGILQRYYGGLIRFQYGAIPEPENKPENGSEKTIGGAIAEAFAEVVADYRDVMTTGIGENVGTAITTERQRVYTFLGAVPPGESLPDMLWIKSTPRTMVIEYPGRAPAGVNTGKHQSGIFEAELARLVMKFGSDIEDEETAESEAAFKHFYGASFATTVKENAGGELPVATLEYDFEVGALGDTVTWGSADSSPTLSVHYRCKLILRKENDVWTAVTIEGLRQS